MSATAPWTGTWLASDRPLPAQDDLVLAIAARRDVPPAVVSRELRTVEDHFDVDAVYVSEE